MLTTRILLSQLSTPGHVRIEAWARDKKLQLNRAKSKEIVTAARRQHGELAQLPPRLEAEAAPVEQVSSQSTGHHCQQSINSY
jgi:hypothetical protein